MNNKENNFTKLNRKLFDYIKKVEPEMHTDAYLKVLNSFNTDGRMTMHNFSIYKEKGDRSSGYATLEIDLQTEEYINFRVSNHLPEVSNIFSKRTTGHPSELPNANICLLFFGLYEYSLLSGSEKGNLALSKKDVRIKILNEYQLKRIKGMYSKEPPTFPYLIYHYIPGLLNDSDIANIIKASGNWFNYAGSKSFDYPIPSNSNGRPMKTPIKCEIVFIKNKDIVNESAIDNVNIVRGANPLISINIGTVHYEYDNEIIISADVFFNVLECSGIQAILIKKLAKELSSDIKQKKIYIKKSNNKKLNKE